MPSNFTEHYNLSQWERTDKIQVEDFNADNAKIDAALKAEADARADALKAEADARASADGAINSTLAAHAAGLAKRGNCQIYTTSYVGNGKYGQSNPNTLTFSGKPLLVAIMSSTQSSFYILLRGCGYTAYLGGSNYVVLPTWGENSVSWYCSDHAYGQLNEKGKTYHAVAFYAMD